MAKSSNGSRRGAKALKVGGAEVRLIKAGRTPAETGTMRSGAVLVPSGSYKADSFPAVERLRRSGR